MYILFSVAFAGKLVSSVNMKLSYTGKCIFSLLRVRHPMPKLVQRPDDPVRILTAYGSSRCLGGLCFPHVTA